MTDVSAFHSKSPCFVLLCLIALCVLSGHAWVAGFQLKPAFVLVGPVPIGKCCAFPSLASLQGDYWCSYSYVN
jgi:hypothetical protein